MQAAIDIVIISLTIVIKKHGQLYQCRSVIIISSNFPICNEHDGTVCHSSSFLLYYLSCAMFNCASHRLIIYHLPSQRAVCTGWKIGDGDPLNEPRRSDDEKLTKVANITATRGVVR
ncbi:uncharacterized protein LOC112639233 [Camponotus floridanus]|uniref:uncharacterized protein LOC112639233 n=1 Tax=Camponotus floridanus TaxID=104421 RepID=UPI000DC687BD|nr:uncharacterized protein LOC112639233 [Camponotus floridanus]